MSKTLFFQDKFGIARTILRLISFDDSNKQVGTQALAKMLVNLPLTGGYFCSEISLSLKTHFGG